MNDSSMQPADPASSRIPWWSLGVFVVMFSFALFGDRGILHLFKQKRQQADMQQQLAQVEEVNAGLRKEIAALSADRRHLERMARSQLGMVREDEVVYQFNSKPPTVSSSAPVAASTPR
jgi:cell division protein FtsB